MAVERSPAFQFYPLDWLGDAKVAAMTIEARGVYIDLICHSWLEGALPLDMSQLARLARCYPPHFKRLWAQVAPCFTRTDAGWVQKRVERERLKQKAFRDTKSRAGQLGNAKRWGVNPSQSDVDATRTTVAKHRSSSSSSSSSSVQTSLSDVCVQKPARAQGVSEAVASEPNGRAERLWERWRALLVETRQMRPPLTPRASDMPKLLEAIELVADDADLLQRLDRFMRLTPDQQKTLNVKAISLGYFVMALPQLVDTPDANDVAIQQWLKAHEHDTH